VRGYCGARIEWAVCVVHDPQHYSKALILFFTKIIDKAWQPYYIWNMSRRIVGFRVACALMVIAFFVTGQTLHAAAAVRGPCYLKAVTSKPVHAGGTGQHSAHQHGCCCDRPAPCNCDLNQSNRDEGSALPVAAATNLTTPASLDPGIVQTAVRVMAYSPERALCQGWVQARAPSEALIPDTTKLIC
jgi:hypothetical protein